MQQQGEPIGLVAVSAVIASKAQVKAQQDQPDKPAQWGPSRPITRPERSYRIHLVGHGPASSPFRSGCHGRGVCPVIDPRSTSIEVGQGTGRGSIDPGLNGPAGRLIDPSLDIFKRRFDLRAERSRRGRAAGAISEPGRGDVRSSGRSDRQPVRPVSRESSTLRTASPSSGRDRRDTGSAAIFQIRGTGSARFQANASG